MIITCNKCSTRFNLDDSLVKEGGSKCRCAVCNHILTAYPLPLEPEPVQPETVLPEPVQPETEEAEPWQSEPEEAEPKASEPWEIEQTSEEASDFDYESDLDDDDLLKEDSDIEMEDLDLSSKDSDIEIENPYLDTNKNDIEIDDDFSFDEKTFDMEEKTRPQTSEVQENDLESEDDNFEFETIESEDDDDIEFETIEFEDADFEFKPFEDDLISFDKPAAISVEKDEAENEKPIFTPDLKMDGEEEPPVTPEKKNTEDVESLEKETKTKIDLPEEEAKEVDPPLKKEKKVIVKPKPTKKKKKSFFRIPVIILLLIFLLAIGAYIASVITGYKIPAIDQYIKKHIPEISEAKPIPNQKSVNGRFVTNSTAGNLFVLTGRIENPSNIAYSHIEIRGALITKNKEEAKIKNAFCGNIITEDMLKTGNISDINTLLTLKEGAHKINVNVAPGASVPFMVVFSDLQEKLENFTVKVAGFDKAVNKP